MTKKSRRVARTRRVLLSLSLVLVMMMVAVGGTIAWLTDATEEVKNTFTIGNIDIDLTETAYPESSNGWTAKLTPGSTYKKDPKVTVEAGSEKCYLFVKSVVTGNKVIHIETNDASEEIKHTILDVTFFHEVENSGWTALTDVSNVWYREVDVSNAEEDATFALISSDEVRISEYLTNQTMPSSDDAPKITFQAYAIQTENTGSAEEAWAKITDADPEYDLGSDKTPWGVDNASTGN